MNRKVEASLNMDQRNCFEGSLRDESGNISLPCVITGYPVLDQKIEFKNNLAANTEDYNKFLMIARVSLLFLLIFVVFFF